MRRSGVRIPLAPPQADIRSDVGFLYAWARSCGACCCVDWCRWCSGRLLGRVVGPGRCVCRWAAARPRAVCAASCARRVVSKPGQAPPPPTGTAARPSGPSGAFHTSGAWLLMCGSVCRFEARPGPATAHSTAAMPSGPSGVLHTGNAWSADVRLGASPRSPARPRRRPTALRPCPLAPSGVLHTGGALGYRTKRVGFMVTFRLFGAEKSVLKLVGADLKDGLNVLVL